MMGYLITFLGVICGMLIYNFWKVWKETREK